MCIRDRGLGQHIRQQHGVVPGQRVVGGFNRHKLDRYYVCALVQHLKIGVLAVGAGLAPEHWRRPKGHSLATGVDPLAVAFHLQLLQVSGVTLQGAVVRCDRPAGKTVKVAVPHIKQAQLHWQVGLQRCRAKVLIHVVRTGQERSEPIGANGHRQRQTNGRPHRITTTHPVPKAEGGADAKRIGSGHVGGERCKMPCHIAAPAGLKPGLGRARIGHGLDVGEGRAGNQEQRVGGLDLFEQGGQFMAIHVGHKVKAFAGQGVFIQRQHRHLWSEIRATNANVDNVRERVITAYGFCVGQHGVQRGMHML